MQLYNNFYITEAINMWANVTCVKSTTIGIRKELSVKSYKSEINVIMKEE